MTDFDLEEGSSHDIVLIDVYYLHFLDQIENFTTLI